MLLSVLRTRAHSTHTTDTQHSYNRIGNSRSNIPSPEPKTPSRNNPTASAPAPPPAHSVLSRDACMAWLLVLGYTKNNLFLSVPEESAIFFFVFFFCFSFAFPARGCLLEGIIKREFETVGKKRKRDWHAYRYFPGFTATISCFCLWFFVFFTPLVVTGSPLPSPPLPPPHHPHLPTILVCTHTLFFPRGFDECDGGHREETSLGELALGWHQKRERKIEDTPPILDCMYIYSDSEEQLPSSHVLSTFDSATPKQEYTRFKITLVVSIVTMCLTKKLYYKGPQRNPWREGRRRTQLYPMYATIRMQLTPPYARAGTNEPC